MCSLPSSSPNEPFHKSGRFNLWLYDTSDTISIKGKVHNGAKSPEERVFPSIVLFQCMLPLLFHHAGKMRMQLLLLIKKLVNSCLTKCRVNRKKCGKPPAMAKMRIQHQLVTGQLPIFKYLYHCWTPGYFFWWMYSKVVAEVQYWATSSCSVKFLYSNSLFILGGSFIFSPSSTQWATSDAATYSPTIGISRYGAYAGAVQPSPYLWRPDISDGNCRVRSGHMWFSGRYQWIQDGPSL